MIGIFVLGLLAGWLWFAIWVAGKVNNYLWSQSDAQHTLKFARKITAVLLTMLMTLLPFIDQIVAYPKWQQLCATTGDFVWGPNMDEQKAFGRNLVVFGYPHEITIFPNIHVTYFSRQFKDSQTGELILIMPHASYYKARGMFYLPSGSGDNRAIFLSECTTKDKDQKVIDYLGQFNLKVVEYMN